MPQAGRFVVLEGLDGAGTTTQVARLAERLRGQGRDVHTTREPSDGPVGKLLRRALAGELALPGGAPPAPATMALLFAADRTDHLAREVEPALAAGKTVLSDRYLLSSLAYQGEARSALPSEGRSPLSAGDQLAWVQELNARARHPDLTILLDVDPEVAARRRHADARPEELYDHIETQRRVAAAYRALADRPSVAGPVERVDGALPLDDVTTQALALIEAL